MEYLLHLVVVAGIYALLALGLDVVVGYTGLPALGHSAFFCCGAYASALLVTHAGVSPWISIPVGGVTAAVLSVLLGVPLVRLSGDYFALASFGFAAITYSVALNWTAVTQGPMGMPGLPGLMLLGWALTPSWSYLMIVGAWVVLAYAVLARLVSSPFGRVLRAIKDDEALAIALGKRTTRAKFVVLGAAAFFAGVAGGLFAHYITFIDPSSFTPMESVTMLLMVIAGGAGTLRGPAIGALILVLLPEGLRWVGVPSAAAGPTRQAVYGLGLTLLVLWRPAGLFGHNSQR